MTLSPFHLALLLVAGLLFVGVAILFVMRRAATVEPVYCVHCWVHEKKVTIVTHAAEKRRWAICQDCVGLYWDFQDEESEPPET